MRVASFGATLFTLLQVEYGPLASLLSGLAGTSLPLVERNTAHVIVGVYITIWAFTARLLDWRIDPWRWLELLFEGLVSTLNPTIAKRPQKPHKGSGPKRTPSGKGAKAE